MSVGMGVGWHNITHGLPTMNTSYSSGTGGSVSTT